MFPLDAEWHSEGEELGPDAGSVSKAERRKQFLDFMATVALHADVSVEKNRSHFALALSSYHPRTATLPLIALHSRPHLHSLPCLRPGDLNLRIVTGTLCRPK